MQPACKLHTTFDDLPLNKFIVCICEGTYEVLVLEGTPAQADLLEAWGNIYAQYLDAMGDTQTRYVLELQREISLLAHRIAIVETCIRVLWVFHSDEVVAELQEQGFDVTKLHAGNHNYRKELKKIEVRLARFRLELKEKTKEVESIQTDEDRVPVDRNYFQKILSRLSKHQGYALRASELTGGEFAAHLKEYVSHISKAKSFDDGTKG